MKALTIHNPWALLIVMGEQDIENRNWKTNYRGPLLIHAGNTIKQAHIDWFTKSGWPLPRDKKQYPAGAVIGMVELVDCVQDHPSEWRYTKCKWGFVLKNPLALPVWKVRGHRRIWECEYPFDRAGQIGAALEDLGL